MDTGTGNIRFFADFVNVKGKLVKWDIDEEVIVKGCKFKVKEIRCYPDNEIVLVGLPNEQSLSNRLKELTENLPDDVREPSQVMRDFIRGKDKKKR